MNNDIEARCCECDRPTMHHVDGEPLCEDCSADGVLGQEEDHRLDDPRRDLGDLVNWKWTT